MAVDFTTRRPGFLVLAALIASVAVGLVPLGASPTGGTASAQPVDPPLADGADLPDEIAITEGLAISAVGWARRADMHQDAIEAQVVAGTWQPPAAGDTVALPDGSAPAWAPVQADENGWLAHPPGGYVYAAVESAAERIMVLRPNGHGMVYVNGAPRASDHYRRGWLDLPVRLVEGTNHFLFRGSRGQIRATLTSPAADAFFNLRDRTMPDLVVGDTSKLWAGIIVVNATDRTLRGLSIAATIDRHIDEDGDGTQSRLPLPALPPVVTSIEPLAPLTFRKVPVRVPRPRHVEPGAYDLTLTLLDSEPDPVERVLDSQNVSIAAVAADAPQRVTFVSEIDGSIQYYGVTPAAPVDAADEHPALVLSLHGAGVDAIGQARAYSAKPWATIVAPTNRRRFGFDWEDWGRRDAMEVLDHASRRYRTDPRRTYLTGHSMGGHGTWQVGVHFPDRFAAIGPSAGWISFWSYAGATENENVTPVTELFLRSIATSDTLSLSRNYLNHGVYILHGGADDNVPVEQARYMNEHLESFHRDFVYREVEGVGHWWNQDDEPGADCVDFAPMFDFFARHQRPDDAEVREVEFVTSNPGISATCRWLTIHAQQQQHRPASASVRADPHRRRFLATTSNVARLEIALTPLAPAAPTEAGTPAAVTIEIDGQRLEDVIPNGDTESVFLTRDGELWLAGPAWPSTDKGPERYGPFKAVFDNRVILVYGARGSAAENEWAYAKARYDAETFGYRGNGALLLVADTDFHPAATADRSVVLYGNAATNAAWPMLLADSPVQVSSGAVEVGERVVEGDDLAVLLIRPRAGSDRALVGAVSGTGVAGMRLCDRLPYFVSGLGFPDWIVIGPESLELAMGGIRGLGFFALDWALDPAHTAWRE